MKKTASTPKTIAQAIDKLKPGEMCHWKFGLISYGIERISKNLFEIHDVSGCWVSAVVRASTISKLETGQKSLYSLNWR